MNGFIGTHSYKNKRSVCQKEIRKEIYNKTQTTIFTDQFIALLRT